MKDKGAEYLSNWMADTDIEMANHCMEIKDLKDRLNSVILANLAMCKVMTEISLKLESK